LPVTFYRGLDQLPPFEDYNMNGRTYRYFKGDPLYGFGYGLSYSTFHYSGLEALRDAAGGHVKVSVKNDSARDGDEVVEFYIAGGADEAIRDLCGFERVHLRAGETREVEFTVNPGDLPKAKATISVGGGQPSAEIPHVEGVL
jgi:beta-glucosidase